MKSEGFEEMNSLKRAIERLIQGISLLIICLTVVHSRAYCQPTKNVTINIANATVEEVFDAIKAKSGYTIAYSNSDVDLSKIVTVNIQDRAVEDAMMQALAGQNVGFVVTANHIILARKPAQDEKIIVSGTISNAKGEKLIGASVSEKGTLTGIMSDAQGKYSLTVPANAVLVVSYIGYNTTEVPVNGKNRLDIIMEESTLSLNEVVVTALGIMRREKSLTYSTQIVSGDELTRAKDPNMITALAGKTAGVQISRSASGLGGSARVVIRGNRSTSGNNQPLYVIDGVPINNSLIDQTETSIGGTNDASNRDGGDGISNLNPDDIESMNILKGPAAAALYGSQAANGVVIITTRKGHAGISSVSFSSNTTVETAAYGIPDFQNSFTGVTSSWGSAIDGSPDYTDAFFKNGFTTINSIALSSGSDKMQTYFSYANTYGEGLIDNSSLKKHNFNFRETANFFNDKLTLDANIHLLYQKLRSRSTPGGYYMNPLAGLYRFPRGGVEGGESFDFFKTNYSVFNEERNMYTQNWYPGFTDFDQNPYWLINKAPSEDSRARTIVNLSLAYRITPELTIKARGNADFFSDKFNQKIFSGTHASLAGTNGRYITYEGTNLSVYGDLLLTYQGDLNEDFSLNASVGTSITDQRTKTLRLDSRPGGLFYPNVFTVANMNLNGGYIVEEDTRRQDQSIFFAGQLGYRDWLFLEATARNDWSSTLAFTDQSGFFYPSVGLTGVLSDVLKMPEWVDQGKVRGAWSQVGNSLPLYISNPTNTIDAGGSFNANTTAPFSELKPEKTVSLEFGTEWKFLGNRLDFDLTYYHTKTTNQLFTMLAPAGSGFSFFYVNAGDIRNKGLEIMLSGNPVSTRDYNWKTSFNFSTNKNEVRELAEDLDFFTFGPQSSNNYQMRLEKGGSIGDIYGLAFVRDDSGNISYNDNGLPVKGTDLQKIANCSPKWNLGWGNTLSYKDFSLFFLIDGRFGGDVMSITQADLDAYGVSKVTGDARAAGSVTFDGNEITDVRGFYTLVGGRDGITEYYVTSATNVRLRELSLSYVVPQRILRSGPVKSCEISFVGRNLFFFTNDAPYDPDASLSTGNDLQGVDVFGMPSNRSLGVNLKLNF